jgi:cell fate regulator YaaT (PSP1 superfamily)
MESVIGIRLRKTGRVHEYTRGEVELSRGEWVVVETEKGIVLGQVVYGPRERETVSPEVKRIIRKADVEDLSILDRNRRKEEEAYLYCLQRINERRLPMKLADVEFILSGGKAIFYFTAEGRVDFRALVKDLATQFHTRIEMRQIGVRDESKMIGGIGPCGRELCCAAYLKSFEPVSIRMAKDQNLALNPQKVSGLCGRLMCCLTYEQSTYEAIWGQIPKIGKRVQTPKGEGRIMSVDIKNHKVRTLIGDDVEVFTVEEIRELNKDLVRPQGDRDQDRRAQRGPRGPGGPRHDRGDRRDNRDGRDRPHDNRPSGRARELRPGGQPAPRPEGAAHAQPVRPAPAPVPSGAAPAAPPLRPQDGTPPDSTPDVPPPGPAGESATPPASGEKEGRG